MQDNQRGEEFPHPLCDPHPSPRRYGLVASAVLRCINNKPTFEAKLQNSQTTYLHKIITSIVFWIILQRRPPRGNIAGRVFCNMELTGLHYSHYHFLSFSYIISREYLKKSARSVVRDDILSKFPLAMVGSIRTPFARDDFFQDGLCVAKGTEDVFAFSLYMSEGEFSVV